MDDYLDYGPSFDLKYFRVVLAAGQVELVEVMDEVHANLCVVVGTDRHGSQVVDVRGLVNGEENLEEGSK